MTLDTLSTFLKGDLDQAVYGVASVGLQCYFKYKVKNGFSFTAKDVTANTESLRWLNIAVWWHWLPQLQYSAACYSKNSSVI